MALGFQQRMEKTGLLDRSLLADKADTVTAKGGIVVLIPRGEVIRNFVYTGVLDEIAKSTEVTLFTVNTESEIDELLSSKYGDTYPLVEHDERWAVRFQREMLEVSHNRWLWSRAARERSRLRDAEAITLSQRWKRSTKKILSYPFASRAGLRFLEKTERLSSRLLSKTKDYELTLKKLNPSLVFNGSHVHSRNAIQAVQAAQWLGIPTATFIFSWDNLTSQGRISLPYDYFLVWNEALKQKLLDMYDWIKPENVFVTGTPQFDLHFRKETYLTREDYCRQIGADPDRDLVLYTTGMPNHMPGEPEIVEGIANMLSAYPGEKRPQLLVRVYAKDLTGRFDELRNRRRDIIFADPKWERGWLTPKEDDASALVNAIRHCKLGINVASTVSLELCMFDKPTINVGYNPPSVPLEELSYADYYEFDHYKPVVDSGAVQVAWDVKEMDALINKSLLNPETLSSQRQSLMKNMFGSTLDGRSGQRVADGLTTISRLKTRH